MKKFPQIPLIVLSMMFLFSLNSNLLAAGSLHHNIGGGLGIPYGAIGFGYELENDISPGFSVGPAMGFGSNFGDGSAWNIGIKTHFLNKDRLFRPGISLWYGTNSYVDLTNGDTESGEGLTLGFDLRFQIGRIRRHVIEFYLLNIISDNIDDQYEEKSDSNIKFGTGYMFRF